MIISEETCGLQWSTVKASKVEYQSDSIRIELHWKPLREACKRFKMDIEAHMIFLVSLLIF